MHDGRNVYSGTSPRCPHGSYVTGRGIVLGTVKDLLHHHNLPLNWGPGVCLLTHLVTRTWFTQLHDGV